MTFLYIGLGLWLLAKLVPYLVAIFEKEPIRNDTVPQVYDPATWKSARYEKKLAEARAAGLALCGSRFTGRHGSVVKGYVLLHLTPDHRIAVALISARICGLEMNKVEARSVFTDGTAHYTMDTAVVPDFTGVITKDTCFDGSLVEVLALHERRLAELAKPVVALQAERAFDTLEEAEARRGEAMVAGGFATWADPAQTKLRRTWKGVRATVRANRESNRRLVAEQTAKNKAKAKAKAPAPRTP